MTSLCIKCKGKGMCGGPCKIIQSIKKYQPKINKEFSGSSPPEIFVGQYGYPNLFTGILAPNEFGQTEILSSPELWFKNKFEILDILNSRAKLINSRFISNINNTRKLETDKKFEALQSFAMTNKHVDAGFKLKHKPRTNFSSSSLQPIIGNPAELIEVKIQENIKVDKPVDYLVSDKDAKAETSILELYSKKTKISHIIKLLSSGLLGLRIQRKLVPTRWAITSIDSLISKRLLKNIRHYSSIQDFQVFSGEYLGNHYEILLIPKEWSFEIIEIGESTFYDKDSTAIWHDYEFFQERKGYASNVTGGYYIAKLAVSEYLEKIKRQATCIFFREIKQDYWAPCGVGILRELCRNIFSKQPQRFYEINDAINFIKSNIKIPFSLYEQKSVLLKQFKIQKTLFNF